jgi:pteridine reductase
MEGKTILITGSARRLGRAIAVEMHGTGANIMVHYHRAGEDAATLVAELNARRPSSAACLQGDLRQIDRLPELVGATVDRFGRLDALVNSASSFFPTPLAEVDLTAWNELVGSNLQAPLFLTQAAAPHLIDAAGSVVNITDIHAERPLAGYPLYCAAKAGLLGLTRALAIELAPRVRVNAVAPGPILWPDSEVFDSAARAEIVADTLLNRVGRPLDVAQAVHYLLAAADYVTGQVINVDGGRTAHL